MHRFPNVKLVFHFDLPPNVRPSEHLLSRINSRMHKSAQFIHANDKLFEVLQSVSCRHKHLHYN